ncbi:MAG: hypothetical protein HQK62_00855 [Desulfamplus sp.]|nr:hypothetical protein [Desulfamplus sp.]MBF0257381.1 hypothetical protein [Desulfamplus sp.]
MEEELLIRDFGSGYDDYKERRDLLKEIEELKKIKLFLEEEDIRLLRDIDILSGELEGIEIALSSANNHILSYEKRKKECGKNIEVLKNRKEDMIKEIDELHLRIRELRAEEIATTTLNKNLRNELGSINSEKSRVIKRLDIVKTGIKSIDRDQIERLPNLEGCDSVLKQVYNVLRETQDRMEISALMKKGM